METSLAIDPTSIPHLLKIKKWPYWVDYDEDTDTLYLSFRKPQAANDSVMEESLIYHYDDKELVGVTILHASEFSLS